MKGNLSCFEFRQTKKKRTVQSAVKHISPPAARAPKRASLDCVRVELAGMHGLKLTYNEVEAITCSTKWHFTPSLELLHI